jgi:hypothetical protein
MQLGRNRWRDVFQKVCNGDECQTFILCIRCSNPLRHVELMIEANIARIIEQGSEGGMTDGLAVLFEGVNLFREACVTARTMLVSWVSHRRGSPLMVNVAGRATFHIRRKVRFMVNPSRMTCLALHLGSLRRGQLVLCENRRELLHRTVLGIRTQWGKAVVAGLALIFPGSMRGSDGAWR